ncbi:MAG: hypothetical protein IJJ33_06980 [Victivallales bacterium]|nr:hypothetical protein [Victivallales bacterium]
MSSASEVLIGKSRFLPFSQDGWTGLVAPDFTTLFDRLDKWLTEDSTVILEAPCRTIRRHQTTLGSLYSKLMRAQNDGAYTRKEWFAWLKWAFGPSRVLHILKVSSLMMAKGHACAIPVLAVRKRQWSGRHLNLLVTQEVLFPTVEQFVTGASPLEALRLSGEALAALHQDSFVHGDFLPRNCCLDMTHRRLFFLDNDKTSHWRHAPFFLQQRNLEQFAYNLMRLTDNQTLPLPFLTAYFESREFTPSRRAAIESSVMRHALARWQRHVRATARQ